MKSQYLGDSYDHVKRVLIEGSSKDNWISAAMMTADATEEELVSYGTFLKCEVPAQFVSAPQAKHRGEYFERLRQYCRKTRSNIFLDPCTGVRPEDRFRPSMREHVATSEIAQLISGTEHPELLLCFDQSLARGSEDQGRAEKLRILSRERVRAFYFKSHASFLCASSDHQVLDEWFQGLLAIGLPSSRFQHQELNERLPR